MRFTLDRFLRYCWKISTLSLVDSISKELGKMNKKVFSFKKKNKVHDTGNKLYIADILLMSSHLSQYPPQIETFLTHLLTQMNYVYFK